MARPCPIRIRCPGPTPGLEADSPITNYSSEYSDGPSFTGIVYPYSDPYRGCGCGGEPPGWFTSQVCGITECASTISQDDADDCAQRLSRALCAYPDGYPPDCTGNWDDNACCYDEAGCTPENNYRYYNNTQVASIRCPDGNMNFYTVYPGTVVATTQVLADRLAYELALKRVAQYRICLSSITPEMCAGSGYTKTITVNGQHTPYTFSIVAGTLPPGIEFVGTGLKTAVFRGTPTLGGNYTVTVRATSRYGFYIQKDYTFNVLGIINLPIPDAQLGVNFSYQLQADGGTAPYTFSIESGALPTGFTMSAAGLIENANPTVVETSGFWIKIEDSSP